MSVDLAFLVFCCSVCAADLSFRRIFNWLLFFGLVAKVLVLAGNASAHGAFAMQWASAVVGMAVGLGVLVPFYALRVLGAGDVKFFAVLGLWLGPWALLPVWLGGSVLAGAHAVIEHVCRQRSTLSGVAVSANADVALSVGSTSAVRRMNRWRLAVRGGRKGAPYAAYLALVAMVYVYLK